MSYTRSKVKKYSLHWPERTPSAMEGAEATEADAADVKVDVQEDTKPFAVRGDSVFVSDHLSPGEFTRSRECVKV